MDNITAIEKKVNGDITIALEDLGVMYYLRSKVNPTIVNEMLDDWIPVLESVVCELEVEMESDPYVKEYDSIMFSNSLRKGRNRKTRQNGKRNADKMKRIRENERRKSKLKEKTQTKMSRKEFIQSEKGAMHGHPVYLWTSITNDPNRDHPIVKIDRHRQKYDDAMRDREKDFPFDSYTKVESFLTLLEDCIWYLEEEAKVRELTKDQIERLKRIKEDKEIILCSLS